MGSIDFTTFVLQQFGISSSPTRSKGITRIMSSGSSCIGFSVLHFMLLLLSLLFIEILQKQTIWVKSLLNCSGLMFSCSGFVSVSDGLYDKSLGYEQDCKQFFRLLCIHFFSNGTFWNLSSAQACTSPNINKGVILLCLREGATTVDIIISLFQACHIRKALQLDRNKWERALEAKDDSESVISEWFKLVEDSKFKLDEASKRCSQGGMKEEIQRSGWSVKNILLSTKEQVW